MDTAIRILTLDEAVCISHRVNTIGKGMNSAILSSAMGKYRGTLGSLILAR